MAAGVRSPPSLRFLGRRVYLGAVVVLVAAMREGPTPARLERLQALVGVCARTVRRWRRWRQTVFRETAVWVAARGLLSRPVEEKRLRGSVRASSPGGGPTQSCTPPGGEDGSRTTTRTIRSFDVPLGPHNRWSSYEVLREKWLAHQGATLWRPVLLVDEARQTPST